MLDKDIMHMAIERYGVKNQELKAMEECSELIQAIAKHLFDPSEATRDHIAEEMADVRIMLDQLSMMFSNVLTESNYRHKKLDRLLDRMLTETVEREG